MKENMTFKYTFSASSASFSFCFFSSSLLVFIFSENYVSNYSLFFLFWLHRQKKTLVW